jgi:hypothetical protein
MRFFSRRALGALGMVLVVSAVVVSSAVAATTPEFKPVPSKKKFTDGSGEVVFRLASGEYVACGKSSATGEITGARTIGKTVLKLTECKIHASAGGTSCPLKSVGAAEGEVVTADLDGELGTLKTTEAPSGVGLLLKYEGSKGSIAKLEKNACASETFLGGSFVGEIATVGKSQTTNKLVVSAHSSEPIDLDSGIEEISELEAWGSALTMAASDELKFEEAVEVT